MSTKTGLGIAGGLLFAGLSCGIVGCGAPEDADLTVGEEADVAVTKSAITATGCASIYVSNEAHVGAIIGIHSSRPEMTVSTEKFQIYNPSDTDCASVYLEWTLTNDLSGTILRDNAIYTSLHAHKSRWVWSNPAFDSRTNVPRVDYHEDVWMYRNGTLMKATYLPQYFTDTGQF